jgi:uncharacterized membrane protein
MEITKERVETFSDGVFAIIITLLVLEIRVPAISNHQSPTALWQALIAMSPKFLSWIISFLMLCVVWVNHHRVFKQIKNLSPVLFWLNALLLLWVCLTPFPTALIGEYPQNPLSLSFFGIVLALMSGTFTLIRWHIYTHTHWQNPSDKLVYKKSIYNSLLFGPLPYLAGAGISWFNTWIAFALYLLVPIYFVTRFKDSQ